jgi:peptide/nickel transport system substrate-binding protein
VVGAGPFLLRQGEWRPGERAIFDRNPNYHPRPEPPDGLSGGKATRVAALQTGELDLPEIVPFDFIDVPKRDRNVTITSRHGIEQMMTVISINHPRPPFGNPLMRRALQAAVGQEDMMAGMGLPKVHNYVLAGQFSAPMAYRSDLHGVVPFGFPVFWGMERK